jgi:hypothetical protein
MEKPEIRIPFEMVEHLIHQFQNAYREIGWDSLQIDAEALESIIEKQSRPYRHGKSCSDLAGSKYTDHP